MSGSPTHDLDSNISDISHSKLSRHDSPVADGSSSERFTRSKATSGSFAGAIKTDARGAIFTDIAGSQYNTYVNDTSAETILATLKPVDHGGYYVSPCMKGTREGIFKKVDQWLDDANAPNILWLTGSPGAGKTAIAASLVARFAARSQPCASFFFRQGDVALSDPAALWRTIAHRLAKSNRPFADVLVPDLDKVDLTRPDIDLHFKFLIVEPLSKCYDHASSHPVPVILIDALDECGSNRSQEPQRKAVLDTLVQWSCLRKHFKLIVTGRDERITDSFRAACHQIVLPSGSDVNDDTNNDIHHFFVQRFAELGGSSFPEWPGERIIRALTACAAGLFIWGETAMKFVEEGLPDEQLDLVLSGSLGDEDNITRLYRQILERSFRDVKGRALEVSKQVISTVVLAKIPFSCNDLHQFLSHPKTSIKFILSKLSAVISIGSSDERIRVGHLSFSEFLCDRKRCPKEFFIDRVEQRQNLAMTCFQQMKDGLRFNICRLETSYLSNDQVEDLSERTKAYIPGPLVYSCLFWAAHLRDTMSGQDGCNAIVKEVKDFLYNRFLHWLEVMSVVGEVSAANIALLTAVPWIEESDADLSVFARDASRFIINFLVPISTSVPHIYLSALPFSPSESLVAKQYQPQFTNTISVVSGRDQTWPATVNLLRGHTDFVHSVMFSSDDTRVISGSSDKTIRIWDAETGKTVAGPLEGHTGYVHSVALSPDGKRVVSGSDDKTIRIWDAETGQTLAGPFEGHTDWVRSVAFSPDGKQIVSGSFDKTIRIWDAETGQAVTGPLECHTGYIYSAAFSPDGKRIVSGSEDQTIRIWDPETRQTIAGAFEGHTEGVNSVAFSPDGKWIVSGSRDTTIRIWDADTAQAVAGPFKGHAHHVQSVMFSPDGKWVVSGSSDKTIRIWDVETGQTAAGPFKGHTDYVISVVFSSDGKRIVSGSEDKTIRIWDAETGQTVAGAFEGHTAYVMSVAFSPDGKQIVSGSRDKTIRIWDAETGQTVAGPFEGHTDWVRSVTFSPDGKQIVSCSRDNTIRIWDAETGTTVASAFEGHTDYLVSVAFSPDGKRIVSGSEGQTIRIWDPETGQTIAGAFEGHTGVDSVAFSPDGKHVVSGSRDTTIRIWDAETGQIIAGPFEGHAHHVQSVMFSPDGKQVVSGSSDNTIRIWDAETGKTVAGPFKGHTDFVLSVAFSPDGKRVVSGSRDTTIRIWDAETGQTLAGPFQGHADWVRSVAFSPDGKRVVSGSDDKFIRIWDAETGQTVADPFEGDTNTVSSALFSPNNKSVSQDNTIRIWDAETGQIVPASLEGSTGTPSEVAPSPNVKLDIPGSLNPVVRPRGPETSQSLMRHLATFQSVGASISTSGERYDVNGWVRASHPDLADHQLLVWVPEACREGLCDNRTLLIIGKRMTLVDLSRFVYGTSWTECYSPPKEPSRISRACIQVALSDCQPPAHAEPSDHSNMFDTSVDNASSGASLCPSRADSHRLSHQPTSIDSPLPESDGRSPSNLSTSNHSPPAPSRFTSGSDSSSSSYTRHLRNIAFVLVPLIAVYYFHTARSK